ncbi:TauD/TfdA family dioxygenase [Amycolatopsis sp. CA-128772]|uniref:TauD/TfdA family dioxygenase n=1 Tax=Amycolatopsis sp. CA-128772 TaxID=2073159 RepID=UPI000CD0ED79|nr:TauD/TfdA family dioxygenase [Amycolatopsis sp. CA-128772]
MVLSILKEPDDRKRSIDSLSLTLAESGWAGAAFRKLGAQVEDVNSSHAVDRARILSGELPERLLAALEDFRRYGNDRGVLVVHGLPVGDLPPTPMVANSVATACAPSVAALLLLLSRLGDPISYPEEKNGALVHDICPVPGEENQQQNTGSVHFELHTENAFHPGLPDFLGLSCLRPDPDRQARLITSSVLEALPEISPVDLGVLREPRFRTRLAPSFCRGAVERVYLDPAPLLTGPQKQPTLRVDYDDTMPLDAGARRAMDALHEALQLVRHEHDLAAGSVAILDNRVVVHGRTAFDPRYDGTDRWLQRLFAVTSIREVLPMLQANTNYLCAPVLSLGTTAR